MTIRPIDIQDHAQSLRVLDLQMKAYLLEAEIIGFKDIPPLADSIAALKSCGETFVGFYDEADRLAGAIAYDVQDGTLTVCRMMVHPEHHRKGIASALLAYVLDAHRDMRRFVVATGTANVPAVRLYEKFGFVPCGERLIAPGITLTEMIKENG